MKTMDWSGVVKRWLQEQELQSHVAVSPDTYPSFRELEERLMQAKIAGDNSFEIGWLTSSEIDFCRVAGYRVDLNDNKDAFRISWSEPAPNYCFR